MFNKLFTIALLAAVFVDAKNDKNAEDDADFLQWAALNNKSYNDTASLTKHKQKFSESKAAVEELNA